MHTHVFGSGQDFWCWYRIYFLEGSVAGCSLSGAMQEICDSKVVVRAFTFLNVYDEMKRLIGCICVHKITLRLMCRNKPSISSDSCESSDSDEGSSDAEDMECASKLTALVKAGVLKVTDAS